jgi:aminomethyltransferase
MSLKTTPLHKKHIELKAKMAAFAGYDMPLSYDAKTGGTRKEHIGTRQQLGIFDVSHMGEFWVRGERATEFLSYVCTRPFFKATPGKAQYCLLLNEEGTIIDDIIVYKVDDQNYWMVVNAANVEKDFKHIKLYAEKYGVSVEDVSEETALIAIQGPKAIEVMAQIVPGCEKLKYYRFMQTKDEWIVARTGYTGEDGVEVFLPANQAEALWDKLISYDAIPVGLAARDTLRLEVGFPLYGHELSDELRPNETFASFAVSQKSEFLGASEARKEARYLPIAVSNPLPKPMRAGESLYLGDKKVGVLTSGSISPLKKQGVGLALLELKELPDGLEKGMIFMLESAGKRREAVLTDLPFVETARVKGQSKTTKLK